MLPKKLWGVRYLPNSAFNCYITFLQPNDGQALDGTVLGQDLDGTPLGTDTTVPASTIVVQGIHANISPWRSREMDKREIRVGSSSYKIVTRFPKTYSIDTGCLIQVNRGGQTQLHNIDSFYDPDGQQVELHIWTWCQDDTVVAQQS
jgi:hypothetical protein